MNGNKNNGLTIKLASLSTIVTGYAVFDMLVFSQCSAPSIISTLIWYLSNLMAQALCVLVLMGNYSVIIISLRYIVYLK